MTDAHSSKPRTDAELRKTELEIEIAAPVAAVWNALTDAEELVRWFPTKARVKPGVGGSIWLSWGPDCEGEAPITIWEPQRRFQWAEKAPPRGLAGRTPAAGPS